MRYTYRFGGSTPIIIRNHVVVCTSGLNETANKSSPNQIGTGTDWAWIRAGLGSSCAIKENGSLWVWGRGFFGGLGLGNENNVSSPVQLGSDTWSAAYMSNALFLGIRTNGTLWGCGRNQNGQVGDGTFINRSSPVQIGTLSGWQSLGENATLQHQTSQMLKN